MFQPVSADMERSCCLSSAPIITVITEERDILGPQPPPPTRVRQHTRTVHTRTVDTRAIFIPLLSFVFLSRGARSAIEAISLRFKRTE